MLESARKMLEIFAGLARKLLEIYAAWLGSAWLGSNFLENELLENARLEFYFPCSKSPNLYFIHHKPFISFVNIVLNN